MNNPIVNTFFILLLVLMAVMIVLCLVRAIIGPRTADRIVATNMMGTFVIVMIAILAIMMDEGYLVDICIIYAMISFLAVVVLTKVYMGIYLQRKEELRERQQEALILQEQSEIPSLQKKDMTAETGLKEAGETGPKAAGKAGEAGLKEAGPKAAGNKASGKKQAGSSRQERRHKS